MATGVTLSLEKELKLPPITKPKLQKNTSTLSLTGRNKNLTRPESSSYQPGLVFVRYGANQQMILNTFCQMLHLVNFMKRLSGCKPSEYVDLVSWKAGELQNISQLTADYAYRYLKNRETYLLVKITETIVDQSTLPQYRSLLDDLDRHSPELAAKLQELSKPAKSLSLKGKWTSMSKKGVEGRGERKSGLNGILAAQRAKTPTQKQSGPDIIGVIAAATEQEHRKNSSSANKRKQSTKLPPISNH